MGVLESPLDSGSPHLGEQLEVRGWLLADRAIDEIRVEVAGRAGVRVQAGFARADVHEAFPEHSRWATSGFCGWIDLSDSPAGSSDIRVSAYAGQDVLHEWRRSLVRADVDAAYRAWRERALAAVDLPAIPAAAPVATWIVIGQDAVKCGRAVEQLQSEGRGLWHAYAGGDAPADDETPYVGVLHADDRLHPSTSALLQQLLPDMPRPDLVYFDHDHLSPLGLRHDPVLKPAWSPLTGRHPAVASRGWLVLRERLADDLPALNSASSAGELPVRVADRCRTGWHLPLPLLTLAEHGPEGLRATMPGSAVRASKWSVSAVIPTRLTDQTLLARCLDGLREQPCDAPLQIIVVLNNLRDISVADARQWLSRWQAQVIHVDEPFNWSRLNNLGASQATGDYLLFLNDDVVPTSSRWLAAMVALGEAGHGAVGAVLSYPDGRIQHAGIYLHGGARPECRHLFRHCRGDEARVRRWLKHDRQQTAVTGACLLTPRRLFGAAGCFDERFPIVFNDVDYCLRLAAMGHGSAVAARACLVHHEGLSRGGMAEEADHRRFADRWAASLPACDPFSHPALLRDRDDWMFDTTYRPAADGLPA